MRIKEDASGLGRTHSYFCGAHLKSSTWNTKKTAPKETTVSNPALTRAKESIRESGVRCRMLESDAPAPTVDELKNKPTRFSGILIQEGLGNLGTGYYYTKEALKSAVRVFEAKKFMADHPSSFEDETRPERSVRDVYGHYENVTYQEAKDGTGQLRGDIVVLQGADADWIRDRLTHALKYSEKYPDKDFLGLSINASGDQNPMDAREFLESGMVVPSAKEKLEQAIAEGLEEVKIVKLIDSAVSCDLVTEAGAKGKITQLLEANKMGKKVKEADKKEADASDEEQDKKLIMDQLKKHGLVKGDEKDAPADGDKKDAPAEEAKDAAEEKPKEDQKEASDDKKEEAGDAHAEEAKVMQAAMHYHKAYKENGYDSKEAAERAVEAMKCAKHANDAMEAATKEAGADESKKEADKKEADKEEPKKEAEENKEAKKESAAPKTSDEAIKLRGENASLKERLEKIETEQYLDKKLKESKLPMSVTKKFKESVKAFKGQKDVDDKFSLFLEGYKAISGEASSMDFLAVEKTEETAAGGISLDDCVEE